MVRTRKGHARAGQQAEAARGKRENWHEPLLWFPRERTGEAVGAGLELDTLNILVGFRVQGLSPASCLLSGPGGLDG